MKDIKTLAKDLNISKESIYKKVNGTLQNELQDHKFKKNGKLYIDDIGESLILQSLRRDNEENEQAPSNENTEPINTDIVIDNVITNDVQNLEKIKFLEAQIQEKENHIVTVKEQLQNKDIEIKELKESNNNQISELKQEYKEQINKLETKITEKDNIISNQLADLVQSNHNLEVLLKIEKDKQQSIIDTPVEQSQGTKKNWFKSWFK